MDVLENKSQRLKKLTEDLIEASKASSGNLKLNLEKINICELLKQAIGEFEDKFADKKLEINTDFPEKKVYIEADNRYMYRVIENVFSNISKYALENSRVYIDVKTEEEKYESYVEAGQIMFTTFHQSYGYEEFIQGIRPEPIKGGRLFGCEKFCHE